MSRAGISKSDVARAVSALRAAGRPTTTRVVRLELGRGSNVTISRFLAELGARSDARPTPLPAMPENVQMQLATFAYSMWELIAKDGAAKAELVGAQCEERVHIMGEQLSRERTTREQLELELCSVQAEFSACNSREQRSQEELAMLREQLRVEQALLKRSEHDRALMLKRLGPLVQTAPQVRAQRTTVVRSRRRAPAHRHD